MKEEYFILCFKVKKEVYWKDVSYKLTERDDVGNAISIKLFNSDRKKLISFDKAIVGFDKVVRMAKRIPKLK